MTTESVTPELLRGWPLPEVDGSKHARGTVVVLGGAASVPGAVALAGLAALRVGAGRVQLGVAESVAPAVAASFPEAAVFGLPQDTKGSVLGADAVEAVAGACASADAVLVGPGLDDSEQAAALVDALLREVPGEVPLVVDAFALGALPECRDMLDKHTGERVLTPNEGELERLLGRSCEGGVDDVLEAARTYGAAVSATAAVAEPRGTSWRVAVGHPGLATAGSGDVLAGLVAGLLARGATGAQAAVWATYLHSMAGERLASDVGRVGFLARELVDLVPGMLTELE